MILDHDPVVAASLVALVGLIGQSIARLDGWLDRRLPHAVPGRRMPTTLRAILALLGAPRVFPIVLLVLLTSDSHGTPLGAGLALLFVGVCTIVWGRLRVHGR